VRKTLHTLRSIKSAQDRAHDAVDLRQLIRTALATNDNAAIINVLPIERSEMPEDVKMVQRALEHMVEDEQDAEDCADTLGRGFIETGIEALRRLSHSTDLGLPSWTITRYEVNLETKVDFGFFGDVYRKMWREHTIAIKVLTETTPPKLVLARSRDWKTRSPERVRAPWCVQH